MTIQKIKKYVKSIIGKKVKVVYNGSRNKTDNYVGVIKEVYDSVFILELDDNLKKSFSYSDILIGIVEIK
jgi:uncharacterized protein Veg